MKMKTLIATTMLSTLLCTNAIANVETKTPNNSKNKTVVENVVKDNKKSTKEIKQTKVVQSTKKSTKQLQNTKQQKIKDLTFQVKGKSDFHYSKANYTLEIKFKDVVLNMDKQTFINKVTKDVQKQMSLVSSHYQIPIYTHVPISNGYKLITTKTKCVDMDAANRKFEGIARGYINEVVFANNNVLSHEEYSLYFFIEPPTKQDIQKYEQANKCL